MKLSQSISIVLIGLVSGLNVAHAKTAYDPSIPFSQFLEFQKLMGQEVNDYKEFLQLTIFSAVAVLTALFTFLNWKTRSDVKKEVSAQLSGMISQAVQDKAPEIRKMIAADMEKSVDEVRSHFDKVLAERKLFVDRWLAELSTSGGDGLRSELTLPELVAGKRILWVDDQPSNNSQQIEIIESMAGVVEQVTSTVEAARLVADRKNYDLIISDMDRPAEGPVAGIQLLSKLKGRTPIVIFCGGTSLRRHGANAVKSGAYAVTASNHALIEAISCVFSGRPAPGVIRS